jgi:hypothetical protein
MHNAIPLSLAALMAVAIIVIGCFYLISPERMTGSFGLKPPASDADTRAWLRPEAAEMRPSSWKLGSRQEAEATGAPKASPPRHRVC